MKLYLYIGTTLLFLGCSNNEIKYGGTCSHEKLKKETETKVFSVFASEEKCDQKDVKKIETKFISYNKNITKEKWSITGSCGKTHNYLVRYEQKKNCSVSYTGVSKL